MVALISVPLQNQIECQTDFSISGRRQGMKKSRFDRSYFFQGWVQFRGGNDLEIVPDILSVLKKRPSFFFPYFGTLLNHGLGEHDLAIVRDARSQFPKRQVCYILFRTLLNRVPPYIT